MRAAYVDSIPGATQYYNCHSKPQLVVGLDFDPLLFASPFCFHGPVCLDPTLASMHALGGCVDGMSTILENAAWEAWGPPFGAY